MGSRNSLRFLPLTIAFVISVLQLIYITALATFYEYTFTKLLMNFFFKLGKTLRYVLIIITGISIYAIAMALFSLGILKYLTEELSALFVVSTGAYISYLILKPFRPIERNVLALFLFLIALGFILSALSKDSWPIIRLGVAFLMLVASWILAYLGHKEILDIGFGFIVIALTIGVTPLVWKFGDAVEKGLRALTSYVNILTVTLGSRIFSIVLGISTFLTILDGFVVYALYENKFALYAAVGLFLIGIYILGALIVYPDIMASAGTAAAMKKMNKDEAYLLIGIMTLIYGVFFALRKIASIFKAFLLALGLIIYGIGVKEKEKEVKKAGEKITAYGILGLSDIALYFIIPLLVALATYFYDEPEKSVASTSLMGLALMEFVFLGIGIAFLGVMLALFFSIIGAAIIYGILHYLFYLNLSIYLYAGITLLLFPAIYYMVSIAMISGEAYYAITRVEENKERIEKEKEEAKKKLKEANLDKPLKDYTEEDFERLRELMIKSLGL